MNILTHEEAKALRDSDHSFDVLKLIFDVEKAVIAKLAQGVSVEPVGSFHVTHFKQSFCMRNIEFQEHIDFAAGDHYLYSAEQLAAARVQAIEYVAESVENSHLGENMTAGRFIRALIGRTK